MFEEEKRYFYPMFDLKRMGKLSFFARIKIFWFIARSQERLIWSFKLTPTKVVRLDVVQTWLFFFGKTIYSTGSTRCICLRTVILPRILWGPTSLRSLDQICALALNPIHFGKKVWSFIKPPGGPPSPHLFFSRKKLTQFFWLKAASLKGGYRNFSFILS